MRKRIFVLVAAGAAFCALASSALPCPRVRAARAVQKAAHSPHKHRPRSASRAQVARAAQKPAGEARYACPMHPEVKSMARGECPKCGMSLREVAKNSGEPKTTGAGVDPPDPVPASRIADVPVHDQDGRELKFYTDLVKGKTVAVNFIFTTCTTICPPLTATFSRVQQGLGERVGRDVHLVSISVDPAVDTPERLKAFASKFKIGPGWTFVTGAKPDIDELLRSLAAFSADKNEHTPVALIINDVTGKRTRTYGLAPPSRLIKVISEHAVVK